jgi:hypothetical protein
VDEFIAQLWQVHLKVKEEGYVQVWCGNLRSNYMLRHFRTFLWGCSGPITWSTKAQMILRPQLNKWNSIPLLHLLVDCHLKLQDYISQLSINPKISFSTARLPDWHIADISQLVTIRS